MTRTTSTGCAALYCRLSHRADGSYEGVEDQEKWGRAYVASKWPGTPVEVFADRSTSTSEAREDYRPGFERLRRWIAEGRVAHVWTVEQSRLDRREIEWFTFAAELDAAGITEVHTDRDGVVLVGSDVAGIKAVLAAGEVKRLKRRVNDRLDEIAAQGLPSGATPFGYRHCGPKVCDHEKADRTLHQVPEQAKAIRWAAEKVLAGWSLASITEKLRSRGLAGAHRVKVAENGQRWYQDGRNGPVRTDEDGKPVTRPSTLTPRSVRSMLTSPTVAGLRVHRGEIVGKGKWKPILPEDVWQSVVKRLGSPRVVRRSDGGTYPVRRRAAGKRTGRKYLLTSGIAECGECGAPLVGSLKQLPGRESQPYLLCHPSKGGLGCVGIQADPTEAHVVAALLDRLDQPGFLAQVGVDDSSRGEITAALGEVDRQRDELADRWGKGQLTTTAWDAANAGLDDRERALRASLEELPPPPVKVSLDHVRAAWSTWDLNTRREVIAMFVDAVIIHRASGPRRWNPDRVEIVWRQPSGARRGKEE